MGQRISTDPSYVYTPEWVAELSNHHRNRGSALDITFYDFVLDPKRQSLRDKVESWVHDLIPAGQRDRVVSRLRKPELFDEARNELAVGDWFRTAGFKVEFEPNLSGLTPDWKIRLSDGSSCFISEVVSSRESEDRQRRNLAWDQLRAQIDKIPGHAVLGMVTPNVDPDSSNPHRYPCKVFDAKYRTKVSQKVKQLMSTAPANAHSFEIDGICFTILESSAAIDHLHCVLTLPGFTVDMKPLRRSIKDKISKYRPIVEAAKIPFVVCVVPEFDTGREIDDLNLLLTGSPKWRGRSSEPGLFEQYRALAAVAWSAWSGDQLDLSVVHNPFASFPLRCLQLAT
jgi:hypothetical protein